MCSSCGAACFGNFGANLLKRSLSVMGGSTRGNNTCNVVDLVRDLRGA